MILFNKKGQHTALIAYGLISVFIIIVFLIISFVMAQVNTAIQGVDLIDDTQKAQLNDNVTRMPAIFDSAYAIVIFLSALVLVASVFFIPTHPLFAIITFPVFVVAMIGNAVFANAIDAVGNSGTFAATYAQMPMTSTIAGNWLQIVLVVGVLSLVAFAAAKVVQR